VIWDVHENKVLKKVIGSKTREVIKRVWFVCMTYFCSR